MKKYLFCLLACLSFSICSFGKEYQGSFSLSFTALGVGAGFSNGIMFDKDYVGVGIEHGAWTLLLVSKEWQALYADYRHHFKTGKRSNFFLQASPGMAYSNFWVIGNSDDPEADENKRPERKHLFYGKAGLGFSWMYTRCGFGVSIQNTFTTPTKGNLWMPFLQLSFYW